jgi:predicted SprT family Zn-dependent metalloprotease
MKARTKKPTKQRRAYLRRVKQRVGSAVLTASHPDVLARKPGQRYRDGVLEEICKGLVTGIDAKYMKWAKRIRVYWNPRLRTTSGLAYYESLTIHLNPKLVYISTAEMLRCLRHELAHLLAWRTRKSRDLSSEHGWEWRHACSLLGIANEEIYVDSRYFHHFSEVLPHRKYLYQCPKCKVKVARVRIFTHKKYASCEACCKKHNNGKPSPKYRFQLKKIVPKPAKAKK